MHAKINKKTQQSERTKEKLLKSVGEILIQDGFRGLKVENISKMAPADKKLIYFHFGDLQGLFDKFLNSRDFWPIEGNTSLSDTWDVQTLIDTLDSIFQKMKSDPLLAQLLIWELGDNQETLQKIATEREETITALLLDTLKKAPLKKNIQPLFALLLGGIYYLNMHAAAGHGAFCGVDIHKEEDADSIMQTIAKILDMAAKKN